MSGGHQPAGRAEVERFLAQTAFTGYQAVPLPHGHVLPGEDASERVEQIFRVPIRGRSFLDVGSYYGLFPYSAVARGAARAVGLEPDPERFAIAQRIAELHGNRWAVRQMRVEDLPPGETFDVITFLNVLHHVVDPLEAVRRLVRICDETLVIEFCLPDDPQMLVRLYDDRARSASWRLARLRSLILRLAAGRLPLMAVGNWPGHRTFYFSPRAFDNLFRVHLGWFEAIRFERSVTGMRRVLAYCTVDQSARSRL